MKGLFPVLLELPLWRGPEARVSTAERESEWFQVPAMRE